VKDLAEIPEEVKKALDIIPVSRVEDVLKVALVRMPDPIAWEPEPVAAVAPAESDASGRPTAH
jgi:ATP-dependent Lon protease